MDKNIVVDRYIDNFLWSAIAITYDFLLMLLLRYIAFLGLNMYT
ncbi:hypothetical protein CWATWH0005_5889 [Crocosphaera watsonii WH 0005]|uniref:Uncharacterized protein n=1 Tax=Crocosphaera watsonii WH 0005 TaxID=423472 RepID=T2ITK8_CROWT|nr:hypothetical protein CWATWH0005_5889 [Crocosphaera watsonii WH 0005]